MSSLVRFDCWVAIGAGKTLKLYVKEGDENPVIHHLRLLDFVQDLQGNLELEYVQWFVLYRQCIKVAKDARESPLRSWNEQLKQGRGSGRGSGRGNGGTRRS